MWLWLLLLLIVVGMLSFLISRRKFNSLPGAGVQLPLIGHYKVLLDLEDPISNMQRLFKKYSRNGLLHVNILGFDQVYVGDFETLKSLFNNPDIQNRGHWDWRQCPFRGKLAVDRGLADGPLPGIVFSQGQEWSEQRRFALKTLRDFGFGKASMEEMIMEEVSQFIAFLKPFAASQQPVNMANQFNLPILNALWRILVGDRFEYTDSQLLSIIKRFGLFIQRIGNPANLLVLTHPWIFKVFPKFMDRHEDLVVNQDINKLLEQKIEEHEATIDYNEPRDYIDKMLIEMRAVTNPESSFFGARGRANLLGALVDMFLAGSETTSTTLTWALLYMAREPAVQDRVQAEIDGVVGSGRLPSLADRDRMPYTAAVILEIQRCGNIVPNGVHHVSARDITVNGMTIPANTWIQTLMVEILKGDHWEDGNQFRPERFLDAATGAVKKDDHHIPFSIGKRQCLGETLAKVELFLFFTGLMQQYRILPEVEGVIPPDRYIPGITLMPQPFKVLLKPRA